MSYFIHMDSPVGNQVFGNDVDIDNPQDGQIIKYTAATDKWENINAIEIVSIERDDYDELSYEEKHNPYKAYIITDEDGAGSEVIDDTTSSVGTTYSSHKIDQELTSINSNITPTSELIATNCTIYRMGALRILQMTNCASAAGGVIGQLAASDRPNQTISAPIFVYQSQKDFDGYLQIDTNGNITAKYYLENSANEWAVPQNGRVYGFVIWCVM